MKRGQGQWTRALRRGVALFLVTVTVWVLSLTADMTAAAQTFRALAESPAFVTAALRAELGAVTTPDAPTDSLTGWQRWIIAQSPTLMAGVGQQTPQGKDDRPATLAPNPAPTIADGEGEPTEAQPVATTSEKVVGKTIIPISGSGYTAANGIYIENTAKLPVDVAALAAMELPLSLPAEGPQVLIMHTHGSEAYLPDGSNQYAPSDTSRTTDPSYNMIRIGDEVEKVLTEMGLTVLHDKTLYDYPNYNGAYDRSLAAVGQYLKDNPTIQVVLDVHRDALIGADGTVYKPVTTIDGVQAAQVMLVMGSEGAGLPHPLWQENLSLAVKIQQQLNTLWPTLARPIGLRDHRYNQQCTAGSLLVEVGSHGNTLDEALAGARMFARAAGSVLLNYKSPAPT